MTTLIEVSGLRKLYRSSLGKPKIVALDGIDFTVREGEMFGLLGPNGAGKTTTVKILLGLTHATSGTASVCGLPVRNPESRRHVGYLPEGHKIPNYLTARQAMSIFGRMSGMETAVIQKRVPELIERVGLGSKWLDVRIKKFSKGMTQRLGLACALIHSPKLLCSTSRPTASIRSAAARSATCFAKKRSSTASPYCSTRTCSLRSSSPATAWRCCAKEKSRPSARSKS